MVAPAPLPADRLVADPGFVGSIRDDELVLFLANVGDGDAQLVLLPADPAAHVRRAVVVDAGALGKLPSLIEDLVAAGLLPSQDGAIAPGAIALVVATHPHDDHIAGMAELLGSYGKEVVEFWDPGYFHTTAAYHRMMGEVERLPYLLYAQPTSGFRRWINNVEVTVLSPAISLRNRFDTYGIELNDSSISLRLEFPASRVLQLDNRRNYLGDRNPQALILGADAWSYVVSDFPALAPSSSDAAKALQAAMGADPLTAQVLKVSHHASKHGVNLELIERINPKYTLVSSVGMESRYGFPHTVTQELIREALDPTVTSGRTHKKDWELGIFYTADLDESNVALGSMALVMGGGKVALWRFGDREGDRVDLSRGRRWLAKP